MKLFGLKIPFAPAGDQPPARPARHGDDRNRRAGGHLHGPLDAARRPLPRPLGPTLGRRGEAVPGRGRCRSLTAQVVKTQTPWDAITLGPGGTPTQIFSF